jgi:hypothetical protein
VSISTIANVIGTFQWSSASSEDARWIEAVMMSDVNAANPINGVGNTQTTTMDLSGLGNAATLVPSALSVQVMCPTALQTAAGVLYMGVMNTQADIADRTESWDSYMNKFVQFQSPRLCAAAKLALRGVHINSYPLNMNKVSEFTTLTKTSDTTIAWITPGYSPCGWAPIIIYNPSGVELELLITVEYRIRFDLDHPASASHVHHPIASDGVWDRMTRAASSLGHGVADIADVVANAGVAVGRARAVGAALRAQGAALAVAA